MYQHKWQYLQRVVLDVAEHFAPIETAIRTPFLLDLFGGTVPTTIPPNLRALLSLPVKSFGIGILNPIELADNNHTTSRVRTAFFIDYLLDGTPLTIANH